MSSAANEDRYIIRLWGYVSKYLLPATITTVSLGIIYGYSAIQNHDIKITHVESEVVRLCSRTERDMDQLRCSVDQLSKQTNGRILSTNISMRELDKRVTTLDVSVPLILQGIGSIQKDISSIRKDVGKMKTVVGILKDREEREK